jgi:hypothetical protein
MRIATDFVGEGLPVIDDQTNQLIAVVSEAQLFHAYSDVTERVRNIETA